MSKKKNPKGSYGYVKAERKRRLLLTLLLFAIPLLIFFSGLIYNGTRNNILTVVAILGLQVHGGHDYDLDGKAHERGGLPGDLLPGGRAYHGLRAALYHL